MMPKGSINGWTCHTCGRYTVAVHKDDGTTPMMLGCRATEGCDGIAMSMGYPPGDPPDHILELLNFEWYKPSRKEYKKLDAASKDHVSKGGLLIRRIGEE
jgi:hypothetical protein